MNTKIIAAIVVLLFINISAKAQNFSDYFENKTLRLDYIFSGNNKQQSIYLDELIALPTWAGRTNHLSELPLEGNGQIVVRNATNKKVIYTTSFSSLFQEWIATDEAKSVQKSFENSFLIPYPKQPVEVEVTLRNSSKEVIARMSHNVNPNDILIHAKGQKEMTPHKYLLKSGDAADKIDLVIMGEGYTPAEQDAFYADAQRGMDAIFFYEPFKSMKDRFNVIAVAAPSKESGVSVPRQNDWRETAVGSHFDTFYSDRYLTTSRVKRIHDQLASIPYEHIVILANTDVYGGGGIYNSYTLTTAHHDQFKPVIAHEFGHSFGGLGDEYFYDDDVMENFYPLEVEPWEQNLTTLVDFSSKWEDMLNKKTPVPTEVKDKAKYPVGVFEGGGYVSKGVYRPVDDCRMRTNTFPEFCPVCQRALKRLIDFYTEN